jgi:predicted transcriptional regulator
MEEPAATFQIDYIDLASEIVSAYVSNNSLPVTELPALLGNVHAALSGLASAGGASTEAAPKATPAQVRKSITHDALVSFEDGKPYKTLRRHLTIRNLTPEAYRTKWGLPVDYPMVAAAYSEQRSSLAKSLGLGQQRRKPAAAAAALAETAQAPEPEAPKASPKASAKAAPKATAKPAAKAAEAEAPKASASKRAPKSAEAPSAEKPAKASRGAKAAESSEPAPKARAKRKVAA